MITANDSQADVIEELDRLTALAGRLENEIRAAGEQVPARPVPNTFTSTARDGSTAQVEDVLDARDKFRAHIAVLSHKSSVARHHALARLQATKAAAAAAALGGKSMDAAAPALNATERALKKLSESRPGAGLGSPTGLSASGSFVSLTAPATGATPSSPRKPTATERALGITPAASKPKLTATQNALAAKKPQSATN